VGVRRGNDHLSDPFGRRERDGAGDETAEAETEEIGIGATQMID
jgi:hypothetical protein